jgi:hypothetical protein
MIVAKNLEQTCFACPSQWEGETVDGKKFYIRYRFGWLSLHLFKYEFADSIVIAEMAVGPSMRGIMSFEEMQEHLWRYIRFPFAEVEI